MDQLYSILWFVIYLTLLISIPLTMQLKTYNILIRIFLGLLLAGILSFLIFLACFAIALTNGMGPE